MKRLIVFAWIAIAAVTAVSGFARAEEDINSLMDRFYSDLADIVKKNIDLPEQCVNEIIAYYKSNRAVIERIREISEKYMAEVAPMMQRMAAMTEEELKALEAKIETCKFDMRLSSGAKKYTEIMKAFTMKYPQEAMKIATQALQLVPGTKLEQ